MTATVHQRLRCSWAPCSMMKEPWWPKLTGPLLLCCRRRGGKQSPVQCCSPRGRNVEGGRHGASPRVPAPPAPGLHLTDGALFGQWAAQTSVSMNNRRLGGWGGLETMGHLVGGPYNLDGAASEEERNGTLSFHMAYPEVQMLIPNPLLYQCKSSTALKSQF